MSSSSSSSTSSHVGATTSPVSVDSLRADPLTYASCYCEENVWRLLKSLQSGWSGVEDEGDPSPRPPPPSSHLFAVFITNEHKQCPWWFQRSSEDPTSAPVVWDYHVVALVCQQRPGQEVGKEGVGEVGKEGVGEVGVPPSASAGPPIPPSGNPQESSADSHSTDWLVYDLDSVLPFPSPASSYFLSSSGAASGVQLRRIYQQKFRVVAAEELFDWFASDRRHMKKERKGVDKKSIPSGDGVAMAGGGARDGDGEEGEGEGGGDEGVIWNAPPPPLPCICGPKAAAGGIAHNLDAFLDVRVLGKAGDGGEGGGGAAAGGVDQGVKEGKSDVPGQVLELQGLLDFLKNSKP